MSVSEEIRNAMKRLGLRQRDLVETIGARGRTSEIVNGKRSVSKAIALKLARKLEVPVEKLIA